MTYPRRTYPHGSEKLCALDSDWWSTVLDATQKVAVYWPTGANAVTLVGYYDTVSAANTASAAAVADNGAYPCVRINWAHPDIAHIAVGPVQHPDERESLPAWIDAAPAH